MNVTSITVEALLASLERRAREERDVPREVASIASAAAGRAFGHLQGRVLNARDRRRVAAYFAAVVRRRVIRGTTGRRAASRAVLTAVVADMRSAGCAEGRIVEELERGWRGQVPDDVLEEVRLQLVS